MTFSHICTLKNAFFGGALTLLLWSPVASQASGEVQNQTPPTWQRNTPPRPIGTPPPRSSIPQAVPRSNHLSEAVRAPARNVYLNGHNIGILRTQRLQGVNVEIDANGNIHIDAPHYDVNTESHYRSAGPARAPVGAKVDVPPAQTNQ